MPSIIAPRPAELEEAAAWTRQEAPREARQAARAPEPARQPVAAGANREAALAEEEAVLVPEVVEEAPPRAQVKQAVEEEEAPLVEEEYVEEAKEKPRKHFSWLAVLLLALGILSLGAFAAAPYLEGPSLELSGDFATRTALKKQLEGIPSEWALYVAGAAGVTGLIALVCLLSGLIARRFDVLSLFLLYLAVLCSAFLLLSGLEKYNKELGPNGTMAKLKENIQKLKESGVQGDAVPSPGLQYYAMAGGAAGACLFFVLAGLFMHRRWWSRILGFFFLLFWPALMAVWAFRKELGLDTELPFELPKIVGTWLR
jgi:hypothetical protein